MATDPTAQPIPPPVRGALPASTGVLAVCAHPDDESFGLGAVIAAFTGSGVPVSVLCFTQGEASTLHLGPGDLGAMRAGELAGAAAELGVVRTELLDYPDGRLDAAPLAELGRHVERLADDTGADTLLVFDLGGVTGHPDHHRATEAALAAAERGYAVLAWAVPDTVAVDLNAAFGTAFVGRAKEELDITLPVDRGRQFLAISRHVSQSTDNPVLWRRLTLLGDVERLRWLHPRSTEAHF
jgi:LmbE family N-acetylglucosaminyl deacetylase